MRIFVLQPKFGDGKVIQWDGELKTLQDLVEGYVECANPWSIKSTFDKNGIQMLVNEEGLLKGLEANENLFPYFYVGAAVFVGEEWVGLTDTQINIILHFLDSLDDTGHHEGGWVYKKF